MRRFGEPPVVTRRYAERPGGIDHRAVADHRLQEGEIAPVAAAHAMLIQDPDVAGPGPVHAASVLSLPSSPTPHRSPIVMCRCRARCV